MEINKTKVYFHSSGNQFRITPKVDLNLVETLPVGTYSINYDEKRAEYYLEIIDDFDLKGKLYGDVVKSSSRILNTFLSRQRSTGVLLVGEKGSGKTLLAQYTSFVAAKENKIPTIVVNKPWHGDEFNAFIQSISQPVIILFDEFEKTYEDEDQEKMLTLFDGVYASQKLFLLTSNDKSRMNSHMLNRPGRLYYLLEFKGLDQSFIKEYCEDNLLRKDYIPAVVASAALFQSFNFDMLKAMVEDMNRYNESPSEVLKYLNVRVNSGSDEKFRVKLSIDGKKQEKACATWNGKPVSEVIKIYNRPEGENSKYHYFTAKNLVKLDPKTRVFKFQNEDGDVVVLTPAPAFNFCLNYDTLASSTLKDDSSSVATVSDDKEEEDYAAMMDADY